MREQAAGAVASLRMTDGSEAAVPLRRLQARQVIAAVPWRKARSVRGQAHYPGHFWSATMGSHVIYQSRLEPARLLLADFDRGVVAIAAQPFLLQARVGGRGRRHVPDFLLVHADKSVRVVNVKPAGQLAEPRIAEALAWPGDLFEAHGWQHDIWTGADPALLANLRFLAGYRQPGLLPGVLLDEVLAAVRTGDTIGDVISQMAVAYRPGEVEAAVLRLLWQQRMPTHLHGRLDADSAAGQAARVPAGHLLPAPLPRPRRPGPHSRPAQAQEHARALPSLLWPGWALRLMPPEGFDFLPYQFALGTMLAVAAAGSASTAARHPAPQSPASGTAHAPPEPGPPGTDQLCELTEQGFGPRKIARITGCSERTIRQLLTSTGLRQPTLHPNGGIDPHWLREQYQARQRSLKDIAAETSNPVEALAAAARTAGIPVRHGINGHAHPLASLGKPGAFPPAVWKAFTRPNAEQRIRRLLILVGQPGLHHAARHLGIRHAILASQIRQLEDATGTTLLHTSPDGTIALTPDCEQFASDVRPVLESLAQSRRSTDGYHGTSP